MADRYVIVQEDWPYGLQTFELGAGRVHRRLPDARRSGSRAPRNHPRLP